MPSRNTKSKQLKKRAKNTVGIYRVLWPEVSFSIVYLKYMQKNKISPKNAGEATISYSNFKNRRVWEGETPSHTYPDHRRCALSSGDTRLTVPPTRSLPSIFFLWLMHRFKQVQ